MYVQLSGIISSSYSNGWTTGTLSGTLPFRLTMQSDCNLVIYDSNNDPLWATGTQANLPVLPCRLMLQNSGSLAVINALDQILWSGGP